MQEHGITRFQLDGAAIEMPAQGTKVEAPELPLPPLDPGKERMEMLLRSGVPITGEEMQDTLDPEVKP